ncbi:acetyltransferase (GNAT) family protein [Georgenia soli]|uniref:Acetyltransferase (GNAT) family protein n=1 Tax=Georgenia soli TaxID=638953 RepID=A0A2A9EJN8_9MICO|nr:GNAT family N-acetyltransferase [Georgenia soli]PFG38460.1 acetyltransferase (GNAT) family protein [Georgenia soli]
MTSPDDLGHQDVLGGLLAGTGTEDPHAGHAHDDPLRPTADLSVRPAVPEDSTAIGDLHARTLRASLAAGVGHDLGPELAAALDPAALGASWAAAIGSPPSPRHRVLTAVAGAQVVGFAAFAPAEVPVDVRPAPAEDGSEDGTDEPVPADAAAGDPAGADAPDGDDEARAVAEILALEVPAAHGRRGHGSRLLAACADLLRQEGTTRVQVWTVQADESRTRFLSQAGFAPAGLRRSLDVGGEEVVEICWYADL